MNDDGNDNEELTVEESSDDINQAKKKAKNTRKKVTRRYKAREKNAIRRRQDGGAKVVIKKIQNRGNSNNKIGETNGNNKVNKAGKAVDNAGKSMQATGKSMQAAGKGMQVAGKGMQKGGEAVAQGSKALGDALVSTEVLAPVGATVSGVGSAVGKGTQVAGKGTEEAGKATEKAGKATEQAGKKTSELGKRAKQAGKKGLKEAKSKGKEKYIKKFILTHIPQCIIAALIIIAVLFLIGLVMFFVNMPGLVLGSIDEFGRNLMGNLQGMLTGDSTTAKISSTEIVDLAQHLQAMGYDIQGYGLGSVEYEKDGSTSSSRNGKAKEIKAINESVDEKNYLRSYIAANENTYVLSEWSVAGFFKSIGNNIVKAIDNLIDITPDNLKATTAEDFSTGMINMVGQTDSSIFESSNASDYVSIDRNTKQMKIYSDAFKLPDFGWLGNAVGIGKRLLTGDDKIQWGETFSYDLNNWVGRYGRPTELFLALHLSTMMPDLTYEIATNQDFNTKVNMGMLDATVQFAPTATKGDSTIDSLQIMRYFLKYCIGRDDVDDLSDEDLQSEFRKTTEDIIAMAIVDMKAGDEKIEDTEWTTAEIAELAAITHTGMNKSSSKFGGNSSSNSSSNPAFTAVGEDNGNFKKYNLNDYQLSQLTYVAYREQGSDGGAAAEASLMANLFELRRGGEGGADGLVDYVLHGGWFAASSTGSTDDDPAHKEIVKQVLVNGKRTMPAYIDEHDCFSDIPSATNNGNPINVSDESAYVKDVTVINNCYGSTYTFYSFPAEGSDPFGYHEKFGSDFHYVYDPSREPASNGTESSSGSSSNGGSSASNTPLNPQITEGHYGQFDYYLYNARPNASGQQLILSLHGSGENGGGLGALNYGGSLARFILSGDKQPDCIVLMPSNPGGIGEWGAWDTDALKELVDKVASETKADTSRLAITGVSRGGFDTWEMLAKYPTMFATAAPIASEGYEYDALRNCKTKILALSGTADSYNAQAAVDAVVSGGGSATHKWVEGAGHSDMCNIYGDAENDPTSFLLEGTGISSSNSSTSSNSGKAVTNLTGVVIGKNEFVKKCEEYQEKIKASSGRPLDFAENAGVVYDVCVKSNINPVICAAEAMTEQGWQSPDIAKNNFWGLGIWGTGENFFGSREISDYVQLWCDTLNAYINGEANTNFSQEKAQQYYSYGKEVTSGYKAIDPEHFTGEMTTIYDIFGAYNGFGEPQPSVEYVDDYVYKFAREIFGNDILDEDSSLHPTGNNGSSEESNGINIKWPFIASVTNHWYYDDIDFTKGVYRFAKAATKTMDYKPQDEDNILNKNNVSVKLDSTITSDMGVMYQVAEPEANGPNQRIVDLFNGEYYKYDGSIEKALKVEMKKAQDLEKETFNFNGETYTVEQQETKDINKSKVSFKENKPEALAAFGILGNMHTEAADYVYRNLKELMVNLKHFTTSELTEELQSILLWPIQTDNKDKTWETSLDQNRFGMTIKCSDSEKTVLAPSDAVVKKVEGNSITLQFTTLNSEDAELLEYIYKHKDSFKKVNRDIHTGMEFTIEDIELDSSIKEGENVKRGQTLGVAAGDADGKKSITVTMYQLDKSLVENINEYLRQEENSKYEEIMKAKKAAPSNYKEGLDITSLLSSSADDSSSSTNTDVSIMRDISISREDFIKKCEAYQPPREFAEYAGVIYDVCKKNKINPVICAAQGWVEQNWNAPSGARGNFWGLGVFNGMQTSIYGSMDVESYTQKWCDNINDRLNGGVGVLETSKELQAYDSTHYTGGVNTIYDVYCNYAGPDGDYSPQAQAAFMVDYIDDSLIPSAKAIFGDDVFASVENSSSGTSTIGSGANDEFARPENGEVTSSEEWESRKALVMPEGIKSSSEEQEAAYITSIDVPYWNGNSRQTMQLNVNKNIKERYMGIFDEMANMHFTILPECTAAYVWKFNDSGRLSDHGYGTAIDVNWDHNWYSDGDGSEYTVTPEIAKIFAKYGFSWGYHYNDRMHFSFTGW